MSDLINWLSFPLTHVQSVRTVDHHSVYLANILVAMNDTFWNYNCLCIVLTNILP